MMKQLVAEQIVKNKIIAIIRDVPEDKLLCLAEALYLGGVKMMEVTFDQSGKTSPEETARGIALIKKEFKQDVLVGAGTVMNQHQVNTACKAGAQYIISPNTNPTVVEETIRSGMVSIPGAMTPTEIDAAYSLGADFVKLFPAGDLGLGYIKSVLAPMNHIQVLAVGGINHENLTDFLKAGLAGVGVGSNLVNKKLIKAGAYHEITANAKKYTSQIEAFRAES
jgi:2-dehydro-3-deoxyphosphogluconate aldolase/(4S)-4-hydroxy-2-oxoglutarate aldolase